jgi:hypothetical protein
MRLSRERAAENLTTPRRPDGRPTHIVMCVVAPYGSVSPWVERFGGSGGRSALDTIKTSAHYSVFNGRCEEG